MHRVHTSIRTLGERWVPCGVVVLRVCCDPQAPTFKVAAVSHFFSVAQVACSTLFFFAIMHVAGAVLHITDHSAVLFFVSLKLTSL
jgi:hypothetical protein